MEKNKKSSAALELMERYPWSPEEDNLLRDIIMMRGVDKWSEVAKILQEKHDLKGRTAKQCRQRYLRIRPRWHNHLDPNIKSDSWSMEQEARLFELHNQHGNKWARISQLLSGRTDNSIKNHFYCTLRKALRRVNRYIHENRSKLKMREIKASILSKIIAVAEEKFQSKLEVPARLIDVCCDIKNRLLVYAKITELTPVTEGQLKQLISDICQFNRAYKKKKAKKKTTVVDSGKKQKAQEEDKQSSNSQEFDDNIGLVSVQKKQPQMEVQKPAIQPYVQPGSNSPQLSERPSNKIELSRSLEFQIAEFLKSNNGNLIGMESPLFQPGSPPHLPIGWDGTSNPYANQNPFAVQNPFAMFDQQANKSFKPILISGMNALERKDSLSRSRPNSPNSPS